MEGNIQDHFLQYANINASKTSGIDNVMQSNAPVHEIQQMREAIVVCKKNIENCQKVLNDDQQLMQNKKAVKTEIERTVLKKQCELNEENHLNSEIRIQIDNMREMSNRIGEYLIQNNNTLQQCSESKACITDLIEKQAISANENLMKKMQVFKNGQTSKNELIVLISNQQKTYKEDLKAHEDHCLQKTELINLDTNEQENLHKLSEELHRSIEDSHVTIIHLKKDKECVKTALHNKQKYHNEILQEIQNQQNYFEESQEKDCNFIDENNLLSQKIETEIELEERGALNQKVYNSTLQDKISHRRLSADELLANTKLLEINKNECKDKYENDTKDLTNNHISRLEVKEDTERKKSEILELLKNIEQDIQNYTKLGEESHLKLKFVQSALDEVQHKYDENLQEYSIYEQKVPSMGKKIDEIKQAINDQQQNIKMYKEETLKLINNYNIELHELDKQSSQTMEEEQIKKATIIGEMNLIKSNFDKETTKQTEVFESTQQQMQSEKQQLDKQLRNDNNSRVLLKDELKHLNEEYDAKKLQLKNEENNNTTPRPTTLVTNTAQEFLAPASITQKSFDELSSSSVDSALFMYRQVMEEKKRRKHQIRKQAKRVAKENKRKGSNDTSQK